MRLIRDQFVNFFVDTVPGPPTPVIRNKHSAIKPVEGVSYIEIGDEPTPESRIFFEFDSTTQTFSVAPGKVGGPSVAPINLYSDAASRASVLVEFDQALDPSATNISDDRIRL